MSLITGRPTRVTFDANVPDAFLASSNELWKGRMVQAFRSGMLTFVPTLEFLEETYALITTTSRAERLPDHAQLILDLLDGVVFDYWVNIVTSELNGRTAPFLASETVGTIRENLELLASGQKLEGLEDLVRMSLERKAKDANSYRGHQDRTEEKIAALILREKSAGNSLSRAEVRSFQSTIEYEDYHERYMARHGDDLVRRITSQCGIPESRIPEIRAQLPTYPYTNALIRVDTLMLHRYMSQSRKVKDGDVYDAHQLVCTTGVDVLVTGDKGMHEMFSLIYPEKRIVRFDEFLAEVASH